MPEPPPVESFRAADGRQVRVCYRLTWAPSGLLRAAAEEADQPAGDGFVFQVYGDHDADPEVVLARLRRIVQGEVARAYLVPDEVGEPVTGSRWAVAGDEVAGRIDWSGDHAVPEPSVVIDGRRLAWDEFGRMLASFEGWTFRMRFDDRSEALGSGAGGGVTGGAGGGAGGGDEGADGGDGTAAVPRPDGDGEGDAEVVPLFGARGPGGGDATVVPSIDVVLTEFLAAQHERLAASTYSRYEDIVDLLRHCLNGYGYQSLSGTDAQAWQEAFDAGDDEAFTRLFGPERIVEGYGEFLGSFMVRKVAASKQQLKDAGTVTRRLARWLAEQGYVATADAEVARERAGDAGRALPQAEELSHQLFLATERIELPRHPGGIPAADWVEDHLPITRVEDGRLWFGDLGPVEVGTAASSLAEVGWEVTVVLARLDGAWRLLQVGTVYP